MSSHRSNTPITAQLERLLSPQQPSSQQQQQRPLTPAQSTTGIDSNANPNQNASAAQSTPTSTQQPAAPTPAAAPSSSDPLTALDNLFAAKFSFQFDNLQHILRYILTELRNSKRTSTDITSMKERMTSIEATGESLSLVVGQANLCKKHNPYVSNTLARLEDRLTKEGVLTNRRLAGLEVQTEKVMEQMATLLNQQQQIQMTQQQQQQQLIQQQQTPSTRTRGVTFDSGDSGDSALTRKGSMPSSTFATLSSNDTSSGSISNMLPSVLVTPANLNSSSSKKDLLEIDSMSVQISKFMAQHGTQMQTLQDRLRILEDSEYRMKTEQTNMEVKLNYLQNENKRQQEKIMTMEDEMDVVKKAPILQSSNTSSLSSLSVPPSKRASSLLGMTINKSVSPSASSAQLKSPPPEPASSVKPESAQQTTASDHLLSASASAVTFLQTIPTPPSITDTDLTTLRSTLESLITTRASELQKEFSDTLSIEKEIHREQRRSIMEAVQQAGESALDAKNALTRVMKVTEDLEKRIEEQEIQAATHGGSTNMLNSSDAQLTDSQQLPLSPRNESSRPISMESKRNSVSFNADPSTSTAADSTSVSQPLASPRTASSSASNRPSVSASGTTSQPSTADRVIQSRGSVIVSRGGAGSSAAYTFSQHDFDRVRAMSELALRRTVQHADILNSNEATSGFRKDPAGMITKLDLDKVKAGLTNQASRVLYLEDKLETLNALTLATRNQTLSLASNIEENPMYKSIQLKLFENEIMMQEMNDKMKLLAHMIAKGVNVGGGGGGGNNGGGNGGSGPESLRSSQTLNSTRSQQKRSSMSLGSRVAAANTISSRSLVNTLAEDERKAASVVPTAGGGEESDEESGGGAGDSHHQSSSRLLPTSPPPMSHESSSSVAGGDTSLGYTDSIDETRSSLAMVLRDDTVSASNTADGGKKSLEQITKDMKALNAVQERLNSIENLDAKLATLNTLEEKLDSLLDLDIKERLTFIERRFNTELTFLRSHVNTKVDASSLKILLEKMEKEGELNGGSGAGTSGGSTERGRTLNTASLMRGHGPITSGGDDSDSSPTRAEANAAAAGSGTTTATSADNLIGSMSRASGRDTRHKLSHEHDRASRERKQRLTHLLTILDKKADHSSLRNIEEFVRNIDRHLRSLLSTHTKQLKQLETRGILHPIQGKLAQKKKGNNANAAGASGGSTSNVAGKQSFTTTVPGYDDTYESATATNELHKAGTNRSLLGYTDGSDAEEQWGQEPDDEDDGDEDDAEAEVDYPMSIMNADDPQLRRPLTNEKGRKQSKHRSHTNNNTDDALHAGAARIGINMSSTPGAVSQLQRRCEDLQHQIAAIHAQLAKKAEKVEKQGIVVVSDNAPSQSINNSNSQENISLDGGLTLNPHVSLQDHPHFSRLHSRVDVLEADLTRVQSLCMYQGKQLRNHREWIAKHAREMNAVREFVKFAQANQTAAVNATQGSGGGPGTASGARAPIESASVTSSAYPSPAVYQLLRALESDVISLRRSLKQKIDFFDLGIVNPHDPTQGLNNSIRGNESIPHPSLEDLRRLLYYLTPQLNSGVIPNIGAGGAGLSTRDEAKVSMLTTKGVHPHSHHQHAQQPHTHHVPPINSSDLQHTHSGPQDQWKCLACDRTMEQVNTTSPSKAARHTAFTSSLSSVAPAGGLVGANTRKLIAATNPNTLFSSPRLMKELQASMNVANVPIGTRQQSDTASIQPRPPAGNANPSVNNTPRTGRQEQQKPKSSGGGGGQHLNSAPHSAGADPTIVRIDREADQIKRKAEKKQRKQDERDAQLQAEMRREGNLIRQNSGGGSESSDEKQEYQPSRQPAPSSTSIASYRPDFVEVVESARREYLSKDEQLFVERLTSGHEESEQPTSQH